MRPHHAAGHFDFTAEPVFAATPVAAGAARARAPELAVGARFQA
jgi:hypothetical protein